MILTAIERRDFSHKYYIYVVDPQIVKCAWIMMILHVIVHAYGDIKRVEDERN